MQQTLKHNHARYDPLNRVTQKSFSDTTPTVKYGYDAIPPAGCTLPALTIGNGIGKRTGMCDAAGAEAWSYDITPNVGWKITDARSTNGVTKLTIVQNNLAGSPATLTYPSGRIVTYATSTAGRTLSAMDTANSINYAANAHYSSTGSLSSVTNGTNIISTYFYNNRLQPCRISVKSSGTSPSTCADATVGGILDFTYNFSLGTADNGNVTAITNNRDNTRSQTFTYDFLNRVLTAKTSSTSGAKCWDEAFGYDPWGNLLNIGRISGYTCSNEEMLSVIATTKNQISGDAYDAAGNLMPNNSYNYDAENHLRTAAGVTYTYDGDGKRVQKSNGKLYWYGTGSDPLDETDLAGNTNNASFNEYIFFNGKRIARRDSSNNVNYYFADHLGTARIVANSAGTPVDDSDFYPFGGERIYLNSSPQNYKFTGKERDSESGLDDFDARYYSSSLGRFMTPDWSASPSPVPYASLPYPQSLNLYSYVQNNPLSHTDPNGHCDVDGEHHGWVWCAAHALGLGPETKKETAVRQKNEAEVREFLRAHPEILRQYQFALVNVATVGALTLGEVGGWGENSTVAPEESAAIETGAAAGAARTMVNGVPQPTAEGEIVVGPNGTAVKIPAGYVAAPAESGSGIVYRPAGSTGDANSIRIMGPNARQPARVIIYNSSGQPIVPATGRTGTAAETHTPL